MNSTHNTDALARYLGGASAPLIDMALAGYQHLIPLDEVIAAMDEVGKAMPRELCCTALGGLSITPTSKVLESTLDRKPLC